MKEYNDYYDSFDPPKEFKESISILDCRDDLNNLIELVELCCSCLTDSKLDKSKEYVSSVLYFFVIKEIKRIENNLGKAND